MAALGTTVVVLLFFGSVLWAMLEEGPVPAVVGIMIVYAVLAVAIVVGVLRAMVQRLREIKGGEEEDARKYKEKQARRKRDAVRGLLFFGVLQVITCVAFLALCFIPGLPQWAITLFLALGILSLAMIIPALLVLRSRFKEIEGGELDAAGKY